MPTTLRPSGPQLGTHDPDRVALEDYLNDEYPGGRQLLAGLDDGPWYEVLASAVNPDSLAWTILAGWPGHVVQGYSPRSGHLAAIVYTLPALAYKLLTFAPLVDDDDVHIWQAKNLPDCTGPRAESDIIARYAVYTGWPHNGPLAARCAELAALASLEEVNAFWRTLPLSDVCFDEDRTAAALAAFAAALTEPRS